uniref:Uncharacterized protein n=1 Tax=Onchocerca volvulus TaxID=6282 RepID=A0A8R1TPR8_ONCVO
MSIYNAFLVFTECMHLSLEKKLARNFNTLDEVIYYTMPYWNKLSNDEKKGWIRRAEAEKSTRRDIQVGKYRDKIKLIMKQFDNGAEFGLNSREIQHARIQERKIDDRKIANINQPFSNLSKKRSNSTSGETEKQFLKKKSVSFVLPQQSIRRQKDQNALIRIYDNFSRDFNNIAVSYPTCWWSYLINYNREIDSRHSSKQLIKISSINSPLRIKEELIRNDGHKNDNDISCQSIFPISQL